nr:MAG TPA: hypothetical protein [Caudoviricetes sp.]
MTRMAYHSRINILLMYGTLVGSLLRKYTM